MPDLRNRKTLFLLFLAAFILKFLTSLFIRYLFNCQPITWHLDDLVIRGDDNFSYNAAMENYIQTGRYYFFNGKIDVYAGRLPHFSLLYLFFRQFVNVPLANFGVVVVQIGLECVAIVFLSLLAARITGKKISFYLAFGLFTLSWAVTFYSIIVLPDSLSASFLIFFVYSFYHYLKQPSFARLLVGGVFLGLVVVLKPYFSLLYLVVGLFFLRETNNLLSAKGMAALVKKTFIFSVPLLLFLAPWGIRNYQIYNRFIPFQVDIVAGYDYTKADLACRNYLQTFGEDFLFWDEQSAGHYFKTCRDSCAYILPAYIFTPKNTTAQVEAVRKNYQELQQNFSEELDIAVAEQFEILTQNYARERPFQYYLGSRLVSLKNFLVQGGPGYLPINKSSACYKPFHQALFYLQVALYCGTLIFGLWGLILLGQKDIHNWLLTAIPIYLLLLFPLMLRLTEGRYFIHSYPFLLLGLVFVLVRGWDKFKWAARKNN